MKTLKEVGASNNPRMPLANITNAPYLFGDPFGDIDDGDIEEGDEDGDVDYGDVDYGDVDALSPFRTLSGDPDMEIGGLNKRQRRNLAIAGGSALGAGALTVLAAKALKKRRQKKLYQRQLAASRANQTIRSQRNLRSMIGKTDRNSMIPFFQLTGAKMNSSPIDPMSRFVADTFKQLLDRQAIDTPFYQETAIGTFLAGTWTAVATGVATNRFFTGLVVQIGTNILNAAPGTVINITATIPTIAGPLVIAAVPFLLTYEKQFDVRFLFFPWQLVSNKPLPVLGQYSNANPITVTVTGIPAQSAVNLIVPGSLHPWTVTMRNSLVK